MGTLLLLVELAALAALVAALLVVWRLARRDRGRERGQD